MGFFWNHEGRLEHATFNPFCHLPLDIHWNQWSVEYGTIANLTSVLGALKNFCHWVYRWDPFCRSAAITPQCPDCHKQEHIDSLTLEGQGVGVRAGHACGSGTGEAYLGSTDIPGKDGSRQGHTEWWTQSALIPDMVWCLAKREGENNPSNPKMKSCAVLALSSASTKQMSQLLKASMFKLFLFYLYQNISQGHTVSGGTYLNSPSIILDKADHYPRPPTIDFCLVVVEKPKGSFTVFLCK